MESNTGRFVWYELMTTDPNKAMEFYTDVIGWKTQPFEEGSSPDKAYNMWVASQGPLGGVMLLPDEAKKMGAPPHWMSNVEVGNVDEAVTQVKAKGGKVYIEPQDVPKVGRFAIIADPQGAVISIFKPAEKMESHDTNKHGEFRWSELVTTDHKAAFAFYSELFGWEKTGAFDMGPMGEYQTFGKGGKTYGGMMTKTKEMEQMPNAWLYYVHTDDLDAAVARVKEKGGKVLNGPMEVPTGERIAQCLDPQGAAFALHGDALAKPAK
jgi:uncharacterized protein